MDLVAEIQLSGNRWVRYHYDATGGKRKKVTSTGKTTDYVGEYIYENNTLYQIAQDEGRILPSGSNFVYEYSYTDQLGNLRLSFRDSSTAGAPPVVTQQSHLGPWGETLPALSYQNIPQRNFFDFTNHERQTDFDLELIDAKARIYDPITPRMWGQDVFAERYANFSPYNYGLNNPLRYIDPDGRDVTTTTKTNYKSETYESKTVKINVTLTVVNLTGSDLSKTMFSDKSGTIKVNGLSGEGSFTIPSTKSGKTDVSLNVETSIQYKVVNSLDQVGKNDHVMMLVNDIPKSFGLKVDPVGLADKVGGHIMAVEKNTLSNGTFNNVATHELGHSLGLDHTNNGGLMNETLTNNSNLTNEQRGRMGILQSGGAFANDGTVIQSKQYPNDYQKTAAQQASEFMRKRAID